MNDVISLADGLATHMGEGVFVLFQEDDGKPNTVVLTPEDLAAMLGHRKEDAGDLSAS